MSQSTPPSSAAPPPPPHRPADDSEEVYFEGSPLLRAELLHMFLAILIALALLFAGAAPLIWKWSWPGWLIAVCWILALAAPAVPPLLLKTTRYRISNYRIDYEHGILNKRIDTLELWHVDDLQLEQPLLQRILRVGTIRVRSRDDTTPNLELRGLPHPRRIFEALKQRIIAVKRQRGVIKMDIG